MEQSGRQVDRAVTSLRQREGAARQTGGPIVMAADVNYAGQLATTLRSLVEASDRCAPLDVRVLTDRFPDAMRTMVEGSLPAGSAQIQWITVDLKQFSGYEGLTPHVSTMAYARLLIPELLPETRSRILYLDADLLVLDEVAPLWTVDLQGAPLGAVLDRLDPLIKAGDPGLREVPPVRDYFNSGVLLLDLERWTAEGISEKALEFLARNPRTPFMDQDALNVACDGRWTMLDTRWNFQNHFTTRVADVDPAERPAIAHFVTSVKPWKPAALSVNASLYDSYRSRTRFARGRRERAADFCREAWARLKRTVRRRITVVRP